MIYATFIAGDEYRKKYTAQVQREVRDKDVHILTDQPHLFPNNKTELYNKPIFSYYDKLIFLVSKVLERKERVTFIDCDWFSGLHQGIELQKDTFYTYALFKFEDFANKPFSMEGVKMVEEVLEEHNYTLNRDVYIGEALMSLPYLSSTEDTLKDLITLQKPWEEKFNQNIQTTNTRLKRWASYGVGYGEGGALTAVLQKYGVKLEAVSNKKFIHNNLF